MELREYSGISEMSYVDKACLSCVSGAEKK